MTKALVMGVIYVCQGRAEGLLVVYVSSILPVGHGVGKSVFYAEASLSERRRLVLDDGDEEGRGPIVGSIGESHSKLINRIIKHNT